MFHFRRTFAERRPLDLARCCQGASVILRTCLGNVYDVGLARVPVGSGN